jgi:predicted ester cyclase
VFLDTNFAVEVIIAKGNTVVARWYFIGTYKGEYLGQPATKIRLQ